MSLYVADQLSHPPPPNPPIGYGKIHRVTSTPSSDLGSNGDFAVNLTTGDVYERVNDVWTLFIAGSGAIQQVFIDYATGTPPDDPTKPAISFPTGGGTIHQWDVLSQTWV